MLNRTENLAIEWLKSIGYKKQEILHNPKITPDFICQDGKRYEVKLLYGTRIIFYSTQLKSLKSDDIILVFDRERLISKFLWGDKDKSPIKIQIVEINNIQIQVSKATREKLKAVRITKRDTYDEIINRLLKNG